VPVKLKKKIFDRRKIDAGAWLLASNFSLFASLILLTPSINFAGLKITFESSERSL